jgi:apolipoprotein N-acyltransferase
VPRTRFWPDTLTLLVAALGGGLLALSGEPWRLVPAGFVSLAVLLHALERGRPGKHPVATGALIGLCFGTVVNAFALFSLVYLLEAFGHFPLPLAWLTAALGWTAQALPYAVAGALTEAAHARGVSRRAAFPLAVSFALRFTPQLFPWRPAAPQVNFLWFAQIADLGGEPLLDLCMAAAASGLHGALLGVGKARVRWAALAALAVLGPCSYGAARLPAVRAARDAAPELAVGVVQSNVGIEMKHVPERSIEILADLRKLTAELEAEGAELTVWAETAYPYRLLRSRKAQPDDERRIVGGGVRGPVLFGAVTYVEGDVKTAPRYNSAWLVRPNGTLGDRVDKSRLLAFGEFVPLWDYLPPLQERFPSRGFEAGENDVIRASESTLGMLICYEDLFFELSRKVVDAGAELLVNMTNDAWFGESSEPALHDMVARLRAIETRRDLVRVVNTGVSSFTKATGEVEQRTEIFSRARFIARTRPLRVTSPYVAIGDWVSPLCGLALLGLVLRRRLKRSA